MDRRVPFGYHSSMGSNSKTSLDIDRHRIRRRAILSAVEARLEEAQSERESGNLLITVAIHDGVPRTKLRMALEESVEAVADEPIQAGA